MHSKFGGVGESWSTPRINPGAIVNITLLTCMLHIANYHNHVDACLIKYILL